MSYKDHHGNQVKMKCYGITTFIDVVTRKPTSKINWKSEETKALLPTLLLLIAHLGAEQCAWALGNVAGEGEELRDILISQGALRPLRRMMFSDNGSTVQKASWPLSNLIKVFKVYNSIYGAYMVSWNGPIARNTWCQVNPYALGQVNPSMPSQGNPSKPGQVSNGMQRPMTVNHLMEILDEYSSNIKLINKVVLKALSRSLKLEEDCFLNQYRTTAKMHARFNYYPPCPWLEKVLGVKPMLMVQQSQVCYKTKRYNHRYEDHEQPSENYKDWLYNQYDEFPGPDSDDELPSKVIDNEFPSNILRETEGIVDWVYTPMCDRAVNIIPGLLRAKNRQEAQLLEAQRGC
nr:2-oxoglutarate (2OG) and Fe(II)-dependent oxygenase superfamily protein [Tanacetum cinerariifolium]